MGTRIGFAVVVAALPTWTACAPEFDACLFADSERHLTVLIREFREAGLHHRLGADNSICVSSDQWAEASRVRAVVDQYRKGAAAIVNSPEHRARLLETLERGGKEFAFSVAEWP